MPIDLCALHIALIEAVEAAGKLALRDYVRGGPTRARVNWKDGGSPVTSADIAVDAFLEEKLAPHFAFAWHSEERPESWRGAKAQPLAFVIDPIDGTRDFANGGVDWCVVVGVLRAGKPIAGAVHMPARGETFSAFEGGGAWRNGARISPLPAPRGPLRANGPRPATEAMRARLGVALTHIGSTPALAHRLLVPLKGEADLALARAGGHDWDLVASCAIAAEAGATVLTISGECPVFGLFGEEHPPLMAGPVILFDKSGAFDLTGRA
ncbi:MAG: 3'(2'),5'-bisphosphate nucleotidase CysQ [Proteobacteria bacterium]|nr:3'(2'),5'-bisphosphate nucleotidase CysQ [Pseudomonadota bacterium]